MITDELREYTNIATDRDIYAGARLRKIADRIDAEHRAALEKLAAQVDETSDMREFCERIEQAANNREDVTLWGVDYTPLPVDADGVPIRVGDVMEWPTTGETFEVVGIGDGTLFYVGDARDFADWTGASTKRHHHAPTVEDVLRKFAEKMNENMGMYTGEAIDADEWRDADRQTIAEFAAKLRLAGDE